MKAAESDCRRVVAKRRSGEALIRAVLRAGGVTGSPPNEAIHDCVARYRRLARQSWKNPPSGRLPEDARQSEERGLSRRLAPLAASLDSEERAGPPSRLHPLHASLRPVATPVRCWRAVARANPTRYASSCDQEGFHIFASTVELSRQQLSRSVVRRSSGWMSGRYHVVSGPDLRESHRVSVADDPAL